MWTVSQIQCLTFLPLNEITAIAELAATGKFSKMDLQTDEDEHSIEMHLPYIRKMFEG